MTNWSGCQREIMESGAAWPRSCSLCGIKRNNCQRVNKLDDKTIRLVDDFAFELKMKLVRAMERKGKSGWESPDWKDECIKELLQHVAKGDPLDVAAYAAFCWYHKWPTWPENES